MCLHLAVPASFVSCCFLGPLPTRRMFSLGWLLRHHLVGWPGCPWWAPLQGSAVFPGSSLRFCQLTGWSGAEDSGPLPAQSPYAACLGGSIFSSGSCWSVGSFGCLPTSLSCLLVRVSFSLAYQPGCLGWSSSPCSGMVGRGLSMPLWPCYRLGLGFSLLCFWPFGRRLRCGCSAASSDSSFLDVVRDITLSSSCLPWAGSGCLLLAVCVVRPPGPFTYPLWICCLGASAILGIMPWAWFCWGCPYQYGRSPRWPLLLASSSSCGLLVHLGLRCGLRPCAFAPPLTVWHVSRDLSFLECAFLPEP